MMAKVSIVYAQQPSSEQIAHKSNILETPQETRLKLYSVYFINDVGTKRCENLKFQTSEASRQLTPVQRHGTKSNAVAL